MRLMDLSWAQASDILTETSVGLLPIGSVENHGPHLPLATDLYSAQGIAEQTCALGNWIQLPTVPVGVSEHHRQFPGTLWVSPTVLQAYVEAIAQSAASHGIQRIVFVNGHGGNTPALDQAARALRDRNIYSYTFEWWAAIPELIAESCRLPHDHAGEMETSMMLGLRPELVDSRRYDEAAKEGVTSWGALRNGVPVAFDTIDFTTTGVVGDPNGASADKGKAFAKAAAEELHAFCTWLCSQTEDALAPKPRIS